MESDELKTTPSNDNIQEAGYWKQVDESYYAPAAQQGHMIENGEINNRQDTTPETEDNLGNTSGGRILIAYFAVL